MKNNPRIAIAAWLLAGSAVLAGDAGQILRATGIRGGLVVHLGCGDGTLTTALRANDSYLVHGLDADAAKITQARKHIKSLGLCGKVTAEQWTGSRLPYGDSLVNLLVAESLGGVPRSEAMRVLCPRGVAYIKKGDAWEKTVKPWPKEVDEWTHYLHDASGNAVARDARVGPPRHMQWMAAPVWCRYHHTLASISAVVSARGRIFYIVDEATAGSMQVPGRWFVVARDAFNGVLLWKRQIGSWAWHRHRFRSGPVQLPRTLVAGEDCVYVPLGLDAPVTALDAATGRTLRVFKGTERTEEIVLHGGLLLAVTGSPAAEQAMTGAKRTKAAQFPNQKAIVAARAETGDVLWKWVEPGTERLMPLTLAAAGQRVFFQAGNTVLCLDGTSGKEAWRSDAGAAGAAKGKRQGGRRRRGLGRRSVGWSVATLVVHDGVVLWADAGRLTALAAKTGKALWNCPCKPGFRSPSDVFVAGGRVWLGPDFSAGRNLRTGKVERSNTAVRDIWTVGHHHRCYREKATDRYILTGKRGIEFLDLVSGEHTRNNWVRGVCQYGVMPCNGLIYAPSHSCGCYMEAKLYGFWALAAKREPQAAEAGAPHLERGPAFGEIRNQKSRIKNDDWPTYRHDPRRSGSTATEVPAKLRRAWQAKLGGRLSAPVVAEGMVVVSAIDAHRVVALDARDGKPRWAFTAGGRVDSPPTVHQGLVLFGCADGRVYCLRASDGTLAWRFCAAPEERRTVALDQVESVWPVHGSVLVEDGVAYAAAGRSSYLDGGIFVYGLDPATGKVVCQARVHSEHPKPADRAAVAKIPPKKIAQNTADGKTLIDPDKSDSFSMAGGATTDVLVSDGTSIYLRQVRFDRKLVRQGKGGRHLFSTTRLLDDAEVHRSHWVLGTADFSRIPVAYSWIANSTRPRWGVQLAEPYGLVLAFDAETAWGARRTGGYTLFAEATRPFAADEAPLPDFRKPAKQRAPRWKWSARLPMRPRAILRAGKLLFLAGMPGLGDRPDAFAAYEGRKGGVLWVASTADGTRAAAYSLPAPPVWDGVAAAAGRLYVVTSDGAVMCLGSDGTAPLEQFTPPAPAPRPAAGPRGRQGRPFAPVRPDKDGKLVLTPETARTTGRLRYQPDRNNLGSWTDPKDYCEWNLQGVKAGTYAVDFAYGSTQGGVGYTLAVGSQRLAGKTQPTGGIKTYKAFRVGTIVLPRGRCTLTIRPGHFTGAIMNFRLLTLTPAQ